MTIDRAALERCMAALVDDPTACVELVELAGDRLAAVARRHLRDLGRPDLARLDDEVAGLVWDIALVLHDHARGWRSDGALPWRWADRPIRSAVAAHIGHATAPLDEAGLADRPVEWDHARVELDLAGADHELLALVREALAATSASERNRTVHLEYRLQLALGDPSPSHTVGAQFGLGADNVRQIDRRVRKALTQVVWADDRYVALRAIPWLDEAVGARLDGALALVA